LFISVRKFNSSAPALNVSHAIKIRHSIASTVSREIPARWAISSLWITSREIPPKGPSFTEHKLMTMLHDVVRNGFLDGQPNSAHEVL
jgi:hypothetical protein